MTISITRRDSLILGAAALGTRSALAQDAPDTDVPMADVKPPEFQIEKGAELHTIRPAKFVDPDSVWWDRNTKKFTDQTGIPVSVNYISWEDLRPQTAVIANTGGGVDLIFGWAVDPYLYEEKLVQMNDLAGYLGAKYGGWFDIAKLYGTQLEDRSLAQPAHRRRHRPNGIPHILGEGGGLRPDPRRSGSVP